jgi:molybdopterin-synthase adenylyltransferase
MWAIERERLHEAAPTEVPPNFIVGCYGQGTTQLPGDPTLRQLYGYNGKQRGCEQSLGNPDFSPAIVASIQAAEVCKVLLYAGEPLRHRVFVINLLHMTFDQIEIAPAAEAWGAACSSPAN